MVKRQLTRVNSFFSNMAKMSNSWRSPHIAAQMYRNWAILFGEARAKEVAGRLPPRVLKGRFGSMHLVGRFFLRATKHQTSAVFAKVFLKPQPVKQTPDMLVEDAEGEDYFSKVGRWRRDAMAAAYSNEHWRIMAMTQVVREPLMHTMFWLQKQAGLTREKVINEF